MGWLKIFFGGMCMGAADIVPGVSGGTIAFILGFYERLIKALSSLNKESLLMLLRGNIRGLWHHFDASFLFTLGAGVLFSILFLSHLILYLLEQYETYLLSFFFGLILASAQLLIKKLDNIQLNEILFFVFGVILGCLISLFPVIKTEDITFMVFLSGVISIFAMLLPGVSGSFILLMLGMYEVILNAVKDLNFYLLSIFSIGALVGLFSFSKLLNYMILNFKSQTFSVLVGVMLGSLIRIWPWQKSGSLVIESEENIGGNNTLILPWNVDGYHFLTDFIYPILCLILGFLFICYFANKKLQK